MNNGHPDRDEQSNHPIPAMRLMMNAANNSMMGQLVRTLIEELFPYFYNAEMLRHSVQRFCTALRNEPCITLFYLLIVLFGFLPFFCFFLFIAGSFLITVVWFVVTQAIVIIVSSTMFGGFMLFLTMFCCGLSAVLGTLVHIFCGWDSISLFVREVCQGLYHCVYDKLAEFGIVPKSERSRNIERQNVHRYDD